MFKNFMPLAAIAIILTGTLIVSCQKQQDAPSVTPSTTLASQDRDMAPTVVIGEADVWADNNFVAAAIQYLGEEGYDFCFGKPDWNNSNLITGEDGRHMLITPLLMDPGNKSLLTYFDAAGNVTGAVIMEITLDPTAYSDLTFDASGEPIGDITFNGTINLYSLNCKLLAGATIENNTIVSTVNNLNNLSPDDQKYAKIGQYAFDRLVAIDDDGEFALACWKKCLICALNPSPLNLYCWKCLYCAGTILF